MQVTRRMSPSISLQLNEAAWQCRASHTLLPMRGFRCSGDNHAADGCVSGDMHIAASLENLSRQLEEPSKQEGDRLELAPALLTIKDCNMDGSGLNAFIVADIANRRTRNAGSTLAVVCDCRRRLGGYLSQHLELCNKSYKKKA